MGRNCTETDVELGRNRIVNFYFSGWVQCQFSVGSRSVTTTVSIVRFFKKNDRWKSASRVGFESHDQRFVGLTWQETRARFPEPIFFSFRAFCCMGRNYTETDVELGRNHIVQLFFQGRFSVGSGSVTTSVLRFRTFQKI
jgi:hypothetical protein